MVLRGIKMIAYKTYAQCPPSIKDPAIPNVMVWELAEIADERQLEYENLNYTVVSTTEYYQYLASIAEVEMSYLNQVTTAKAQSDLNTKLQNILINNQISGLNLIVDFGKRNMLLGKSEAQIDLIMEDPDVGKLCLALISGSYKYALRKIVAINNPAITEADKQYFITKITDLLSRKF
jgi:hypothetical protein